MSTEVGTPSRYGLGCRRSGLLPFVHSCRSDVSGSNAAALFNQAGYQISGYSLFNFTTTF